MTVRVGIPLALIITWASLALFGPLFSLSPNSIELSNILIPGNAQEWLGFDDLGRPILDRLIVGARTSFFVAFSVVAISLVVGSVLGTVSAYLGGWTDLAFVRVMDIFLAFPGILLAIALAGVMGPGIDNVVIALCVVGWVGYARLARAYLTLLGLQLGALLSGAVITETVFSWPGIGSLVVEAIHRRDYPVVQATVLLISFSYVMINLFTDLVYAWVDPRVRLTQS